MEDGGWLVGTPLLHQPQTCSLQCALLSHEDMAQTQADSNNEEPRRKKGGEEKEEKKKE